MSHLRYVYFSFSIAYGISESPLVAHLEGLHVALLLALGVDGHLHDLIGIRFLVVRMPGARHNACKLLIEAR